MHNSAMHGDFIAYRPSFAAPPESSSPPKRRISKPVARDRRFPDSTRKAAEQLQNARGISYGEALTIVLRDMHAKGLQHA